MHISWNCRHEVQYSTIFIKYVSFIAPCYIYQKRFSNKPTYIYKKNWYIKSLNHKYFFINFFLYFKRLDMWPKIYDFSIEILFFSVYVCLFIPYISDNTQNKITIITTATGVTCQLQIKSDYMSRCYYYNSVLLSYLGI